MSIFCLMWLSLSYAIEDEDIPDELQDWAGWVLKDEPTVSCPIAYNHNQPFCAYPGVLNFSIENNHGRFGQAWAIYAPSWVPLPGDSKRWPEKVILSSMSPLEENNQSSDEASLLPVVSRNGKPHVRLNKGRYHISGEFGWQQIPESIAVADFTGLIDLSVNNQKILFPDFRDGQLWLKTSAKKTQQNNRLAVQVFRKISDTIPLKVTTQVKLKVSGQTREIKLQGTLLKNFIPAGIHSPLPAVLDKEGRLRLQIKPGQWTVSVSAYYAQQADAISLPAFQKPWPADEIWVLERQPQLRRINVMDKISIDARQTQLPSEWKRFPAYRMQQNEQLAFKIVKRGDPQPEPDQLQLVKKIWLGFDGKGFTVNDHITGKLSRQWRLNAAQDLTLGQVTLNGKPQYITADQNQRQGVEVRHGSLNLLADSRIDSARREFSATGWDIDFKSVKATLYLPAGWKLFSLDGANASRTWLKQWTLLDLFVVLITAIAFYKLWGIKWGLLGLSALILTWHQIWAPQFIWINIIIAIALLQALPQGRLSRLVNGYRFIATLGLVLIVLPFVMYQARTAVFPQLEFNNAGVNLLQSSVSYRQQSAPAPASPELEKQRNMARDIAADAVSEVKNMKKIQSSYYASGKSAHRKSIDMIGIDPDAMIQTGPGLPAWTLHQYAVNWDGPVSSDQSISMILIPPWLNALLNILRILLVLFLVWRLLDTQYFKTRFKAKRPDTQATGTALLVMCLAGGLSLWLPQKSEAAFPSQALLDELRNELTRPAKCLPDCASIETMGIDLSALSLDISLQVHALEDVIIPLPVPVSQWVPENVSIDGEQSVGLLRRQDSSLWMHVKQGSHRIVLGGRVDNINQLYIGFSLKPHHFRLNVSGWSTEGMDQDSHKIQALRFTRTKGKTSTAIDKPAKSEIPVLSEVTRTLSLDLDWYMTTQVRSVSGNNYPVILTIPLLSGESVISEHIKVEAGNAIVSLSRNNEAVQWTSTLSKSKQLILQAMESKQIIEKWKLNVSPIWHIEHSGIPVIYHQREGDRWQPQWQPWPGERVTVNITRPGGVKGKTITIDSSTLKMTPGERITAAALEFNLRSSLGGQHIIQLPDSAELQSVSIDNRNMPIRNTAEGLTLPISPGKQKIAIAWNEPRGIDTFFHASKVNLGIDSVNNKITINPGYNRWVLWAQGPTMGPAVLFWGIFGVILIISLALGRIKGMPLNTLQWVLLWIGLSASAPWSAVIILGSILALRYRVSVKTSNLSDLNFNAMQLILVVLILLSLSTLVASIQQGLLGTPDMQITGNGSTAYQLNWYRDRLDATTPDVSVISVPVMVYRLLMLAWSIWLAFALIKWAQWGWQALTAGEYWRRIKMKRKPKEIIAEKQST